MSEKTLQRLSKIQAHLVSPNPLGRLHDQVCIITGVGNAVNPAGNLAGKNWNIGSATAWIFAREGARQLYLVDLQPGLEEVSKAIKDKYPNVLITTLQADTTNESFLKSLCERAITEHGRLDVFFANSGIASLSTTGNVTREKLENVFNVNTISYFLAIKHASQAMKHVDPKSGKTETGGSIICTASVAGIRSGAGGNDYSASKAAVISLCQTSANMLANTNIRVNAICPGVIESGMTKSVFDRAREKGRMGKFGQLNPLKRFGIPEEIAQVVLFLASEDASYVNGVALPIDGGLSSSHPVVPGRIVSELSSKIPYKPMSRAELLGSN